MKKNLLFFLFIFICFSNSILGQDKPPKGDGTEPLGFIGYWDRTLTFNPGDTHTQWYDVTFPGSERSITSVVTSVPAEKIISGNKLSIRFKLGEILRSELEAVCTGVGELEPFSAEVFFNTSGKLGSVEHGITYYHCAVVRFNYVCDNLRWFWKQPTTITLSTDKEWVCANEIITFKRYSSDPAAVISTSWKAVRNATFIDSQGDQARFRATGTGYMEVEVSTTCSGEGTITRKNSSVWIGPPNPAKISIPYVGYNNTLYVHQPGRNEAQANWNGPIGALERFEWYADGFRVGFGGLDEGIGDNKNIILYPNNPPSYMSSTGVKVRGYNRCGCGQWTAAKTVNVSWNSSFSLRSNIDNGATLGTIKAVRIYDLSGRLMYVDNNPNNNFDIKYIPLNDGIYILEKWDGKETSREKIILKK